LPKLDIVAVDELLCGFNRGVVVLAIKLDRPHEMTVTANDINSIIAHLRHLYRRKFRNYAILKVPNSLFGSGLGNAKS
jgi:hypothetical protein